MSSPISTTSSASMLVLSVFLLAASVCALSPVVHDVQYHQDLSFRSRYSGQENVADWEALPFSIETAHQVVYLENSGCLVAVADRELFSASLKKVGGGDPLSSPFNSWKKIHDFSEGVTALFSASHGNDDALFAFTSDNVLEVSLDNELASCGAVKDETSMLKVAHTWGEVLSCTASPAHLWISSVKQGLSQISLRTGLLQAVEVASAPVRSVYWVQEWSQLFVGTPAALYTYTFDSSSSNSASSVAHEWVGAIIDTVPLDMSYDTTEDALWIAETNALHKLTADGALLRFGLAQGAPMDGITSVAVSNGFVWAGSSVGVSRLRVDADPTTQAAVSSYPTTNTGLLLSGDGGVADNYDALQRTDPWRWQFFSGNRHLSDNAILAIVSAVATAATTAGARLADSTVLVVSSTGLSLLQSTRMSLAKKAQAMGTFQNPRHNREGLTTGVDLLAYGDVTSYQQHCDDNDGLWTSMHAMGETYRYMTTGEHEAREWAWTAFEALEKLAIIPGAYPKFPARSFCHVQDSLTLNGCSGDPWMNSTTEGYEDYMWKSTTSSDELDGHFAVLPLLYDHIAQTDEEKKRVYDLIDGITGGILDNDLYLIDPATNEPTQWGFWNPEKVNDDPEHYSERGTNSVGILAYTASAYSVTGDVKYKDTFWELGIKHGYIRNSLNAKIDSPEEDNHSDNELLFQTYHILFYALQRLPEGDAKRADVKEMVDALIPSIDRMWTIVSKERSPLWLGIYAGTAGRPVTAQEVSEAVWTLRRWSIDMIVWPVINSERFDLTESPYYPRDADPETTAHLMRQVIAPQERRTMKANGDPFVFDDGSGTSEEAPYIWRLPYYLMRYNGLIVD